VSLTKVKNSINRRPVAFTLIELLIVVAIIAILAAIAVPNFLEAQQRAKVAAAKNDMRAIATGLESYAVDNNQYPYTESQGATIFMPAGGTPRSNPSNAQCGGITSPIAYLSSVPNDVFKHLISGVPVIAPYYYEKAGFCFENGVYNPAGVSRVPTDIAGTNQLAGLSPMDVSMTDERQTPARWALYSLGPDLSYNVNQGPTVITQSRYHLSNRYDPTNGTVSPGNILRFPGSISFP